MNPVEACPCGSGNAYGDCCGPLHGGGIAPSAVALMRSRYSAYVLKLGDYLLESWHPSSRPPGLNLADDEQGVTRWLGLTVKSQGEVDDAAMVEFIVRYKVGGAPAERVHELSRFIREQGRWFYLDGVHR